MCARTRVSGMADLSVLSKPLFPSCCNYISLKTGSYRMAISVYQIYSPVLDRYLPGGRAFRVGFLFSKAIALMEMLNLLLRHYSIWWMQTVYLLRSLQLSNSSDIPGAATEPHTIWEKRIFLKLFELLAPNRDTPIIFLKRGRGPRESPLGTLATILTYIGQLKTA